MLFFSLSISEGMCSVGIYDIYIQYVYIHTRYVQCGYVGIWRTGLHTPTKISQEYPLLRVYMLPLKEAISAKSIVRLLLLMLLLLFSFSHRSKFRITVVLFLLDPLKPYLNRAFFVPASGGVSTTPIYNFKTVHDTATKITKNTLLIISN